MQYYQSNNNILYDECGNIIDNNQIYNNYDNNIDENINTNSAINEKLNILNKHSKEL